MNTHDFDNTDGISNEDADTTDASQDDATTDGARTGRRPLGYWLRTVDLLISREYASAFENEGVTRRDWMLLNALAGEVDAPGLAERLARKGKRLRGLADRGWIAEQDGTWTLTDEGRAAKERLGAVVSGIRSRVAGTVSPEDFATTVASLEAIARELGWDETMAGKRGPFGRRGFGRPGFGRGFRPGFGPAFGPAFGPGFGYGPGFGPFAMHPGHRGGFGPYMHPGHRGGWGNGYGYADGGHGHRHGGHGHDGSWHGEGNHGRSHHRPGRHAQRAYERGFDAGFSRGRDSRDD